MKLLNRTSWARTKERQGEMLFLRVITSTCRNSSLPNWLLFFACCGLHTGCLRMGMVEHYAPILEATPSRTEVRHHPRILLLRPTADEAPSKLSESLGTQFVFGLVPATRLYFEQGLYDFVLEATIETMQHKGFDIIVADKTQMHEAVHLFQPHAILRFSIPDVSVNAYDFFFGRVARASIALRFDELSINRPLSSPKQRYYSSGSERRIRTSAQAPLLSLLLRQAVSSAITSTLEQGRFGERRWQKAPKETRTHPSMVLLPPQLEHRSVLQNIPQKLAASYGFAIVPAFSTEQTQRVIQRGLSKGITDAEVGSPIVLLRPIHEQAANSWFISTRVTHGRIHDEYLELAATISVLEGSQKKNLKHALWRWYCTTTTTRLTGPDGFWVRTLERAAQDLIRVALDDKKEHAGTSCKRVNGHAN